MIYDFYVKILGLGVFWNKFPYSTRNNDCFGGHFDSLQNSFGEVKKWCLSYFRLVYCDLQVTFIQMIYALLFKLPRPRDL